MIRNLDFIESFSFTSAFIGYIAKDVNIKFNERTYVCSDLYVTNELKSCDLLIGNNILSRINGYVNRNKFRFLCN